MPRRVEGKDEFSEKILAPGKGERDYNNTVFSTFQSFADRTIWLKSRVEELRDLIGSDQSSNITVGEGIPTNNIGKNGDLFINSDSGVFYYKKSDTWSIVLDPIEVGSKIESGNGSPDNTLGNDGDLYIDLDTNDFYYKVSESWQIIIELDSLGKLDSINNIDPINKNINILAGSGIEVESDGISGSIKISLYQTPSASLSNNIGTVEIGTTITSVTLNWSYNKTEISQSLNNGIGSLSIGQRSYVHSPVSITSGTTYSLSIDDGTTPKTANTSLYFRSRNHWGTSSSTSLTSSDILSLQNNAFDTNKKQSFTIDGNGEYLYYAYPASYGTATFTVNGLLNTAWTESIVSHTNNSGYTTNYRVYRSNTIQNGSDIVVEVE